MYYETFLGLCKGAGVTPNRVARSTGIASATMSDWKRDAYTPKVDKLQAIADYFGVPLSYLMEEEDADSKENVSLPYYLNDETADIAQRAFEDRQLRLLFNATKDATPQDIQAVYNMLQVLIEKGKH